QTSRADDGSGIGDRDFAPKLAGIFVVQVWEQTACFVNPAVSHFRRRPLCAFPAGGSRSARMSSDKRSRLTNWRAGRANPVATCSLSEDATRCPTVLNIVFVGLTA